MQVAQHALLCFIRMFLSAASHFDGRNGFAAAGCWHDGVASFEEERLENDMKTAIVYVSTHHGNTKKLVDAIAAADDVTVIDASAVETADLSGCDCLGFASGIAFGKYAPQLLRFMSQNLPEEKRVFFLHTAGSPRENQNADAKAIANAKRCTCLGTYCCKGFDTYGPFKLIGGIAKGHPTQKEIAAAVQFYKSILC